MENQTLPPEIWLEIFEWATFNSFLTGYTPFQNIPGDSRDPSLHIKSTLSLVCRSWREWSTHLLYKEIRIRHGAHALKQALGRTIQDDRLYGSLVRRVVLPYPSTAPSCFQSLTSIDILKLCPHLEILIRPQFLLLDGLRYDFDVEGVHMPSLRRLEWWHHSEAERTGGINSLGAVLRNAPNLRFLFIGGVVGPSHTCIEPEPVALPMLETLRLCVISGLLLRQILFRWALPSLINLIMDSPLVEHALYCMLDIYGPQLQTVEFGKHVRFLMKDFLSPCLKGCPVLKELNYYVFFTMPPETTVVHPTIETVRLHAAVNSILFDGPSLWALLERHFSFLGNRAALPALQRVVLCGDWRPVVINQHFYTSWKHVTSAGRVVEISSKMGHPVVLELGSKAQNP
ncbi:hypothetical protein K443DRAFT_673618 [Laccaria amethystina LaAM-08-1]|uniref:F-box domain-containing protein n=1 Tax=Laccaria amethystina LaAM-08-1 TaxID=1095629 RepID=A0A0C9Y095_9AGAR|nr:hypothetical protein K443DRAFT_673618 [Laccaria amethystina LaAM-08-1]